MNIKPSLRIRTRLLASVVLFLSHLASAENKITQNVLSVSPVELQISKGENNQGLYAAKASFSWTEKWLVNYVGFLYGHEIQILDKDIPYETQNCFLIGHQMRVAGSQMLVPISFGLSVSNGIYRGKKLPDNSSNDDDLSDPYFKTTYHEEKHLLSGGAFFDIAPSIRFYKAVHLGVDLHVNLNARPLVVQAAFGPVVQWIF